MNTELTLDEALDSNFQTQDKKFIVVRAVAKKCS
jgi:hypothetical protein